jgi:adenylate cyclase
LTNNNEVKADEKRVRENNRRMFDRLINFDSSGTKHSEKLSDLQSLLEQTQDRLSDALSERYQYNTSIKRGQDFLLNHVSSKVSLVILYADLVGSTDMSMTLPPDKLVTIIRAFSHEMSSVVRNHNGYVLKYVGDAVIAFFDAGFNKYFVCDNAVNCAESMINVLTNGLNPILSKDGLPQLRIKIGITEGENVVVQYGFDKSSQLDILGYSLNVAAKITSLTPPNKISVGENIYKLLHPELQSKFHELANLTLSGWRYINHQTGEVYKVYAL